MSKYIYIYLLQGHSQTRLLLLHQLLRTNDNLWIKSFITKMSGDIINIILYTPVILIITTLDSLLSSHY